MTENPLDRSMSQIIRCRYVQFGCTWMVQFQIGEQDEAQMRRRIHEEVCTERFHQPLP